MSIERSINLFPYVLARIGGGPFAEFAGLNLPETAVLLADIWRLRQELVSLKEGISDALYERVGVQTETAGRTCLINLRRDIFNERPVPPETMAQVEAYVPASVYERIQRYRHTGQAIARLQAEGAATYRRECDQARQRLRQLAQKEHLQKGLLLSSRSLREHSLPAFLSQNPISLGKQARKTEQSLIKYLSRIYAKTTPFSTFTNLALGYVSAEGDAAVAGYPLQVQQAPQSISHIRLNNNLYRYLKILLTRIPELFRHFPLRPNPTLTREDDHYLFLLNNDNIESFQRIPFSPILALFHQITAGQREGVVYHDVVQAIIAEGHVEATAVDVEAYMNELIAYGFLEFNLGVSGIDPNWDLKLNQQLAHLTSSLPLLEELRVVLQRIRQLANQYAAAAVRERETILEAAYAEFKAVCMKLHDAAGLPEAERQAMVAGAKVATPPGGQQEAFRRRSITAFPFRLEQMFYEDVAFDTPLLIQAGSLAQLVAISDRLLGLMAIFEGHQDERSKMRHYFWQKYGRSASVDLLTFYEDYYREFKQPEVEKQAQAEPDQADGQTTQSASQDDLWTVADIQERQKQYHIWAQQIAVAVISQADSTTDQINLASEQIEQVHSALGLAENGRGANAYGVFMQPFTVPSENGSIALKAVLNGSCPGFGKMMSRFLHIFDQEVTSLLRTWNQAFAEEALLVENCDASFFNANLHPPLMPFEIWMSGGHNSLPAQQQIAVTELKVTLSAETDELQLLHQPTQKRCYVFDLGFQGYRGRSELFQLLEQFTLSAYLSYHPLLTALNNYQEQQVAKNEETKVWIQPRIVLDGQLVLQRKAWFVPKALLPLRNPGEGEWEFFARLNAWRLDHKIPDEVFVYVVSRREFEQAVKTPSATIARDDYKPQYICFHNPFLVSLLEKLFQKTPHTLRLEEMLPNSQQLLRIGSNQYATEFIVQWYDVKEGQC